MFRNISLSAKGLGMLIFMIVILIIVLTIMRSYGLDTTIVDNYITFFTLLFVILIFLGFIKGGGVRATFR